MAAPGLQVALLCALLVVAAAVIRVDGHGLHAASTGADACASTPTATVTFVKSCTVIDVTNAACWAPKVPAAGDVVMFPAGTAATMAFVTPYTPLSVTTVYVEAGASVTMQGGAFAVAECLTVAGSLTLTADVDGVLDNGTVSTIPFVSDASVPHGTDCALVPQGFTPRLCGPGSAYVSGTLTLTGLYASLWTATTVGAGGNLQFGAKSFLWGNVTNYGTIVSNGMLFLHGAVYNAAGARASFEQLRPDVWTHTPGSQNLSVPITNYGELLFVRPKNAGPDHPFVSTRDNGYGNAWLSLQIVNYNSLTFLMPRGLSGTTSAFLAVDIVNHGTTTWMGDQLAFVVGVLYNYGTAVANQASVGWIRYVADGGVVQQINGGSLALGLSVDMERRLKSLGFSGPFVAAVELRNSVIKSDGAHPHVPAVTLHGPIEVYGDVTVAVGATLRNGMTYPSTVLQRVSTGRLLVRGRYEAGVLEVFEGSHDRVVVTSSGELHVGEKSAVVMRSDAGAELQAGALTVVKGSLETRRSGDGMTLSVSRSSITLDADRITGDFPYPAMSYNDFL